MPFLENVTRGRGVPRERLLDVAHHYELFGGVSPINEQNRALIAALETELRAHGIDLPVYFGNRNWRPFIADAMTEMRDDGVRNALAFLTSAYSSYSGCRQYRENLFDAQQEIGADAPAVSRLRMLYNHPGFVAANADHVRDALKQVPAGGAPRVHRAFDPGRDGAQLRVRGAAPRDSAARGGGGRRGRAGRSCTSRGAGRRRCRGSSPTCPTISRAARAGAPGVVLSPIGFVSDHLEVLYDLDVEARETAERSACPWRVPASAGTHPAFVAAIREAIEERLDSGEPKRAVGRFGPSWDTCAPDCCCPATGGPRLGTLDAHRLGRGGCPAARAIAARPARLHRRARRCCRGSRRCAGAAPVVGRAPARGASRRPHAGGRPCGTLGAARARQGVDVARNAPPAPGARVAVMACGEASRRGSDEGLPAWRDPNGNDHPPLDAEQVAAARAAVRDVLDGRCLLRQEIVDEVVARVGPEPRARLSSGFAFFLGDLCQGPPRGAKVTFVRPDQWVTGWSEPAGAEALREACRRFLFAYGPARPSDFLEWFGAGRLTAADGRALFESLELEDVEVEGRRAYVLAGDTTFPPAERAFGFCPSTTST